MRKLTSEEASSIKAGELVTIATVMAILSIGVMIVIIYRLFRSNKGTATIPGGFKFTWN